MLSTSYDVMGGVTRFEALALSRRSGYDASCNSWLVVRHLRCTRLQDRRYKTRHLAARRVVDESPYAE